MARPCGSGSELRPYFAPSPCTCRACACWHADARCLACAHMIVLRARGCAIARFRGYCASRHLVGVCNLAPPRRFSSIPMSQLTAGACKPPAPPVLPHQSTSQVDGWEHLDDGNWRQSDVDVRSAAAASERGTVSSAEHGVGRRSGASDSCASQRRSEDTRVDAHADVTG